MADYDGRIADAAQEPPTEGAVSDGQGEDVGSAPRRTVVRFELVLGVVLVVLFLASGFAGYLLFRELQQAQIPVTSVEARIAEVEAQIEQDPDNPAFYLQLADANFGIQKYDEAIQALDKVRSLESTGLVGAQAAYGLARISEAQKDYDAAETYFNESLKLKDLAETRYGFGRYYASRDMVDEAIEQWERYLEISGGDAGAMRDLAKLYEGIGDDTRALALYKEAYEQMPDDAEVREAIERLGSAAQ